MVHYKWENHLRNFHLKRIFQINGKTALKQAFYYKKRNLCKEICLHHRKFFHS